MSLNTGTSKLSQALKALKARWADVRTRWNDPVSQGFEENHFTPLEMQVQATLRGIDRLARELDQAKQECG